MIKALAVPTFFRLLDEAPWIPKLLCAILLLLISTELMWGVSSVLLFNRTQALLFAKHVKPVFKAPMATSAQAAILPLFGDSLVLDATSVVLSPLNVTLVGIFYTPNQADCEVILQLPNKQERVFHVGDTLVEGARLKQVERDEIFIVRQGRMERLSLPEKGLRFDPPAKPLGEE